MDQEELQKNIALYYSKLPPKLQEIFSSMQWLQTLQQISEKYSLTGEQIQTLGTETTLVLLGIIHPDEYYSELETQLKLGSDSLSKMLAEINSSVINTIRPELINVFDENKKTSETENLETADLDKKFKDLPETIKTIIAQSNYKTILYEIAREYGLNVIEMGVLESNLTDLIIGSIHPEKFEDLVKNSLKLGDEKTQALVSAVNEKIIKEIREKMEALSNTHTFDTTTQNDDNEVLNNAGIEIIPTSTNYVPNVNVANTEKKEVSGLPIPEKLEINSPLEESSDHKSEGGGQSFTPAPKTTPEVVNIPTPSILAQKLSVPTQIPTTKTDHSLPNITPASIPSKPKIDPYREIPE